MRYVSGRIAMSNFAAVSGGTNITTGVLSLVQTAIPFTGHSNGWTSVTGDGGAYSLDDAWLAVFGNQTTVIFVSLGDQVSFNGPSSGFYDETLDCVGGSGAVNVVHAHVTLSGQDNAIFFDASDDVLNLFSAANAWNTLYASSGTVNLNGAALNVLGAASPPGAGRVVTINSVSGVNAVSLYQNDASGYLVNGDDVTVTLTNTTAAIHGSGDHIWLVGGSASSVLLDLTAGQFDTVYGAGKLALQGGSVVSVGGGALVDFVVAGGVAYLSYTQGIWDQVTGASGTLSLRDAQAVVEGGGQTVEFASGDDAASLYQTGGNWDAVYGDAKTLSINSAQANVYGVIGDIYLNGAGAAVSIYGDNIYSPSHVHAQDSVVILSKTSSDIIGGGDAIYFDPSGYNLLTVSGTEGLWDRVYGQNENITLSNAQASVFGGGNVIQTYDARDAVSLYDTGANADFVEGGGAVTLNDATASLFGSNFFVYFGPGTNALSLAYSTDDDLLTFVGRFGQDTISNFLSSDAIALSKAEFADFNAFQAAFTQQGDDAVLTLDADDKVTFLGLQVSAIKAAQVKFV